MTQTDHEIVMKFIAGISDPEEREEWLAILREKRPHPPTPEKIREYGNSYRAKHREEMQERTNIRVMRGVVLRHPFIAFDLFDGVFSYLEGRRKGSGWSYYKNKTAYCRSCNKRIHGKPPTSCSSTRHMEVYKSFLDRLKIKRMNKQKRD